MMSAGIYNVVIIRQKFIDILDGRNGSIFRTETMQEEGEKQSFLAWLILLS
jgi:hypothetical protein